MPALRPEDLSPFGRLALRLDSQFAELVRAGEQMSKVTLDSDAGLDEGIRILNKVAQYGESLAATMQDFAQALQQSRDEAEAATKLVAERAQLIKSRKETQDALEAKLERVKEEVKAAGAQLSSAQQAGNGALSEEDRARIAAELQKLQAPMTRFIEAAQAIKAEAADGNFKRVERQAESMIDSLEASRRKIAQALSPKS
jgi:hypothetical protein